MTYAAGEKLSDGQLADARAEKGMGGLDAAAIIARVNSAVDAAVEQIRRIDPHTLTDAREVGRQRLPSTVLGLVFHTAEHAARHAGQMATLKKVITPVT